MRIQVKLLATYRRYLPPDAAASSYTMEVRPDTRVEELLAGLPVGQGDETVVLVNGRTPEEGTVLREGDVVCLFPAIAGG